MTFWTENNFEPKRSFRFKLNLGYGTSEENIPYFYLKSAKKPTFDVNTIQHKVGGREFNFPGSVKWNDVSLVFVDDVQNTVISKLVNIIQTSNYPDILAGAGSTFTADSVKFVSKEKLAKNLTTQLSSQPSVNDAQVFFTIEQLNAEGLVVEGWNLYNPIVIKLEQDDLDYGKEDLSTYTMTVKYDWAAFSTP